LPDCLTRISHTFFVRQTSNSAACMPAYLRATHNQVRCSARAGVASNSAGCGATIAQTSKSAASRVQDPPTQAGYGQLGNLEDGQTAGLSQNPVAVTMVSSPQHCRYVKYPSQRSVVLAGARCATAAPKYGVPQHTAARPDDGPSSSRCYTGANPGV